MRRYPLQVIDALRSPRFQAAALLDQAVTLRLVGDMQFAVEAFVSPPAVSSRYEVNVIGCATVPFAVSDPKTRRYAVSKQQFFGEFTNFTTTPARTRG